MIGNICVYVKCILKLPDLNLDYLNWSKTNNLKWLIDDYCTYGLINPMQKSVTNRGLALVTVSVIPPYC